MSLQAASPIACTPLGLGLSLLPTDVQIGKLLLLGAAFEAVREAVLTIAAGLSGKGDNLSSRKSPSLC